MDLLAFLAHLVSLSRQIEKASALGNQLLCLHLSITSQVARLMVLRSHLFRSLSTQSKPVWCLFINDIFYSPQLSKLDHYWNYFLNLQM